MTWDIVTMEHHSYRDVLTILVFLFSLIYEILARYTSLSTGRGQHCRYNHGFVTGKGTSC